MSRYQCSVCGYIHDTTKEGGWDELPDDWTCPVCGAGKAQFAAIGGEQGKEGPVAAEAQAAAPSSAGRGLLAHRMFGYVFLAIYLVLMVQMVPRLWTYQIEFPARTVVHLSLGMAIGAILIVKIGVVRFFRRLDQALVPMLGTSLLVGSVVLIGISVPAAFREALTTGRLFTPDNLQRVEQQLILAGLEPAAGRTLATASSLRAGQRILRQDCVECHDLRTVLARPRTPQNWRQTVSRMADRSTLTGALDDQEQWQVTAYLVALSPQLQKSTQQLREAQDRRDQSQQAADKVAAQPGEAAAYDPESASKLFQAKCSQCHDTTLVSLAPPASADAASQLVTRMVEEGLEATADELAQIAQYLTETYVKSTE